MKLSVSDLMDGCRDSLDLTHVIPNGDLLPALAEIAVRAGRHGFKGDGNRGGSLQSLHENIILLDIAGQGTCQLGKGLPVRLGDIKDRDDPKPWDLDLHFLRQCLASDIPQGFLSNRIKLFNFLFRFDRGRGNDADAFFTLQDIALELILPAIISSH